MEMKTDEQLLVLAGSQGEMTHGQLLTQIEIAKTLKLIAEALHATEKEIYVTIPDGGGLYTLQEGATTVDFEYGKIIQPDGSEEKLRTGLQVQGLPCMRSFLLSTAGDLQFSIDGGGFYSLGAGERYSARGLKFKQLYIDALVPTYIKLIAATIPEMTTMYDRFLSADLETAFGSTKQELYDADERAAQTVSLDCKEIGKLTIEAFTTADAATNFYLEASVDNSHWFLVDSVTSVATWHAGYLNSARYVRLRSAVSGVPGNKVSLILSASR